MNEQTKLALKMAMEFAQDYLNSETFSPNKLVPITGEDVFNACKEVLDQPAQELLSDDRIKEIADDIYRKLESEDRLDDYEYELARAIEIEHKIGIK